MKPFCLEVTGNYACFTRPEMKVERVSHDLITPSAARAVFESILWEPGLRRRIRRIEVLKPVRWISVRRNEVAAITSSRNALTAMKWSRAGPNQRCRVARASLTRPTRPAAPARDRPGRCARRADR